MSREGIDFLSVTQIECVYIWVETHNLWAHQAGRLLKVHGMLSVALTLTMRTSHRLPIRDSFSSIVFDSPWSRASSNSVHSGGRCTFLQSIVFK